MANVNQICNVKSESYGNSIIARIYDHLVKGTLGDCILSVEGKFVRAHKLILSISSEYFENIFNISSMDKPVVVIHGVKFLDLCFILDFAYLGQAQVPQDHLDAFLKAGELLQIRGIKEGRIHFLTSHVQSTMPSAHSRSFDSTISSTQESNAAPNAKRPREDDDISIQEASEIMKMLLDSSNEPENDNNQVKNAQALTSSQAQQIVMAPSRLTPAPRKPMMTMQAPRKPIMGAPAPISNPAPTKPKFLCRFCGRALTTQGRINRHETECSENPEKVVAICDVCKAELKPSSLSHHKNTKHGSSKTMPTLLSSPITKPLELPVAVMNLSVGGSPTTQLNDIGTTSQSPEQKETAVVDIKKEEPEPEMTFV